MSTIKAPPPPIQTQFQDKSKTSGISWPWEQWFLQTQVSYSDNEPPAGTLDGVNKVFTLKAAPVPADSLILVQEPAGSLGSVLIQGTQATPLDYFLSAPNQITYTVAPPATSKNRAWYRFKSSPNNPG